MIDVQGLVKRYGTHTAVDGIDFHVESGEILGFLGPNGAGKSTTMNILTGYLSATEGTVRIGGFDVLEEPDKAKALIGYLPEQPPLYQDMTVKEYLEFMYQLKRCKLPREKHLTEIARLIKIDHVYGRLIRNLSKGYKQRVGLAQALIGDPPILILDEPTVGLDPTQIIEIRSLIKSLGKRHTVILSSHILSEIESVCNRIVVISEGHIVADDTAQALSERYAGDRRLTVTIDGPKSEVEALLRALPHVEKVETLRERGGAVDYMLTVEEGQDVRYLLFERLADRHWPLLASYSKKKSLEEIFLLLTQPGATGKGGTAE
ncbi:MAG: ATP-binding cassette domain-containing protein [Clostridia bacterium]|nr:ATP-binding cassette domain-containing protein [Clostridia bacterium]